jgi:hypothetical protein
LIKSGTARAGVLDVEVVDRSKPPRRWSKRSLILIVSSLSLGVLALVVGVVGVARSVSFVLDAVDATANVGQIAPDRATVARNSVTPESEASRPPTPSSPNLSTAGGTGSGAPPSVVTPAASATQAGGSNGEVAGDGEAEPFGGVAGVGGGGSGGGGGGGAGGAGGSVGAAGASPLFWERVAQSVLALVGQTTISMCGPNTCNVGQVCCNASCGICVAPGATCDQAQCAGAPRAPTNFLCGRGQCNDGQICCNPSCGICVAPGETCSEQPCR